jgi:hypothetical protein
VLVSTPAKRAAAFALTAPNPSARAAARYAVAWDAAALPPHVQLRGARSVEVPPGGSREAKFTFSSLLEGRLAVPVTLTDQATGEYYAYELQLEATPPGPLRVTLLANVTAAPVTDPAEVRRLLVEQVTGRVRWRESMLALGAAGVEHFVELGGKVVGPMITRTLSDISVASLIGMADIEAFAKEI